MNQTVQRTPRHMRAYTLGLEERLQETNHKLLTAITQIQHEPNKVQQLQPIVISYTRRAQRIQALLDATTP